MRTVARDYQRMTGAFRVGRAPGRERISRPRIAPARVSRGWGFLVGAVLFTVVLASGCSEKTIPIGFAGPLTGELSDLGVQGRNGAQLAVEAINRDDGIRNRKLKLVPFDDQGTPEGARAVARRFVDEGVYAVIGHMTSDESIAALPITEDAEIVMLSPTTSTPLLSRREDLFFRIQTAAEAGARVMGTYAHEKLELERVGTVRDGSNRSYADPFNDAFVTAFTSAGGTVPTQELFESESFPLLDSNLDGVLMIGSARRTAWILQQMENYNAEKVTLASGWAGTPDLIMHAGQAAEGVYLPTTGFVVDDHGVLEDFSRKYRARFGREPSFAAIQAYEAVRFLAVALDRAALRPKDLPEALLSIDDFTGIYGPVRLDQWGDAVGTVTILQVRDGEFVPVARETDRSR